MSAIAQTLKDIGPTKLSILAAIGVVLLGIFAVLSFKISAPNLATLYSNLESRDSGYIITELESRAIPYTITNNGTQISVPANKVLQLRMILAQKGLPSSGTMVGYEIFDNPDALGTSNFVHNVNLLRALEGELGRTIGAFDNIEHARVHLVMPKRELFARKKNDPTASVVLQLIKPQGISKNEIHAISHLVATAVPGLQVANITIVDTKGRPFKLGAEDKDDPSVLSANSEDFRISLERRMTENVTELLERSVGPGNVEVHVSADIDFDRVVTNSETYDPDGQVVRSVQTVAEVESATEKDAGNVSVGNNLPNNNAGADGASNSSNAERTDETINYEISKTIKNHIKETGTVKRLSVAVLVDGTYTLNDDTDEYDYTARSDEELEKLRSLVKSAIGYDEKRGDVIEVVSMEFSRDLSILDQEKPFDWIKDELHNILQTLVVAVVVILVIMLVIRPMVGRAFEMTKVEEDESEFEAALSSMGINDPEKKDAKADDAGFVTIEGIESRVEASSLKNLNEIVEKYPEETLSVFRGWVNKE